MKAGMPFFVKQKKKQTRFCRKPKILQMRQSVISINMALPDLPFRKWKNSVPISGRKWLPMRKKSSKEKDTAIYNPKVPKKLRIGDSVKVLSMNLTGTVHSLPNAKGDLFVQMGILRSQVNIKDLVLIEDAAPGSKKYAKTGAGKLKMSKSASVSTEINLIGKTVDEAIALLDKYLDDAYLAHLPSVRIVHGKGTGALRSAVQSHLKRQSYIKSFHLGEFGEGDAGVTIAEFK